MEVAPFLSIFTIFCRFSPFFVDFHHFLSIFTIYALLSPFTFCRDLRTFSAIFFGQNSLLRNITRFLHVCMTWIASIVLQTPVLILIYFLHSFKLWIFFYTFGSTPALCPMDTARMYRLYSSMRSISRGATEISDGETFVSLPIDSMKKMTNQQRC